MESEIEIPSSRDLVSSLDEVFQIALNLLPQTTTPQQLTHLCSSIQTAQHQLNIFLSQLHPLAEQRDDPMHIAEEEEEDMEEEENSRIDNVEEKMRNVVIQNKRRKRSLSPEEHRPLYDNGVPVLDAEGTRLRLLDLVFQFHG
ncbi:hypothetical protein GIB67_019268 [Kingdonia uniflora]|uniref:Uncharacterized protein n=1 Tax=Kingdonia uniflora TaxID=39325 RepID=A0A7J7MZX1_9MAGN|nr:hypothetical protein GIB67_019268 [Kingdonia uniflora]